MQKKGEVCKRNNERRKIRMESRNQDEMFRTWSVQERVCKREG